MIVSVENDVSMRIVESLIERLHLDIVTVRSAGAEKRLVKVGERASAGMRGEVRAEPLLLRAARVAPSDLQTLAVERDDVPRSEVVAVVAFGGFSGGLSEIFEVERRSF